MTEQQKTHISKFLSLVLRHKPQTIGIMLDSNGWTDVTELRTRMARHNMPVSMEELEEVVATNAKQRFAFNEDHTRIRANQGHSIDVELNLTQLQPPVYLYHGTVEKFLESIRREGLQKMARHHVHLSADIETAERVGARRGKPIILQVASGDMFAAGFAFYLSGNGVWLTDTVPPKYINFKNYDL